MKKQAKGFTLIELMIVVAIIGILAAIAIPKFADLIRKSNEGATKGNLGSMRSALSIYFADIEGFYPCGVDASPGSVLITNLVPKYIKSIPSCYCAGHHTKTAVEYCVAYNPADATDNGQWGYDGANNVTFDLAAAAARPNWGTFWIQCDDTDTKSTLWSRY